MAFWRQAAVAADQQFTGARLKDSTRHWFEINHVDYLRALQHTLDQLAPA
jgi:hypothetical protein